MKILFITSRLPWPLDKGDRVRAYHQMRMLNKDHEVFLFTLTEEHPSKEAQLALSQVTTGLKWYKVNRWKRWLRLTFAALSSRPFQIHWFYQRKADHKLHQWMGQLGPDVIHCQLVRMAEYVRNDHQIPKVLDYMDALSAGMNRNAALRPMGSRWIFQLEAHRLARYESIVFDYFDGQTIISQADRKLIAHPGRNAIDVIPNGVDSEYFNNGNATEKKPNAKSVILFTGNMSYPPNVDAAKLLVNDILPKIQTPDVQVVIAGTKPTIEVQKLASDQVIITGWIDDLRTAYASADAFVAPLRIGTGQQNKILEAMAMELPCITTPHVLSGFPEHDTAAPPLVLAESPTATAHAIDELLTNKSKCAEIGKKSRIWIEKNSSWEAQARLLEESFVNSTLYKPEEATWKIKR